MGKETVRRRLFFGCNTIYNVCIVAFEFRIVVPYGCGTWYLAVREECWLNVLENGILRRIFWPKRDLNGEWTRLHNVELHSLYCSPNIIRVIMPRRFGWAGHVARMEEGRSIFTTLIDKVRRPLGGSGVDGRKILE